MVLVTQELRDAVAAWAPQGLSPEQASFAEGDAEILIAAAGSGKTEALLGRFMFLLQRRPLGHEVQIISFTNAAANTFQSRFATLCMCEAPLREIACTLHSWAKHELLKRLYGIVEERVSMIVTHALVKITEAPETVRPLAERLQLLVDEAQDCGAQQLQLLYALRALGARVALVGDPRQAIYAWQGADAQAILALDWTRAQLDVNRRSSRAIVELSNLLIASAPRSGLEDLAPQRWHPSSPQGDVPGVSFVHSLSHEALGPILQPLIQDGTTILTYRNSDVDRLHQVLALLHYDSAAFHGADEAVAGAPLQVRTTHSSKGDGYLAVVLVESGFPNAADALQHFETMTLEQRQEELRRHYVAITRARRYFHLVIVGSEPPVWWSQFIPLAREQGLLQQHSQPPKPRVVERAAATGERALHVEQLCSKYQASDSLLSHSHRHASSLADGFEQLQTVPLPKKWRALHLDMTRFALQHLLCPRNSDVEQARAWHESLHLPSWHLHDLQRMAAVSSNFYLPLAEHLGGMLQGQPISHVCKQLLLSQRRLSRTSVGNPTYALVGGQAFLDLHHGAFALTDPLKVRIAHRIRAANLPEQLLRRRSFFDATGFQQLRLEMLLGAEELLAGELSDSSLSHAALCHLFTKPHRTLPYLLREPHLAPLDLETVQSAVAQLHAVLEKLHSEHDLLNRQVDLQVQRELPARPAPLLGTVDLYVPGDCPSYLFFAADLTLETETRALVTANLNTEGAHRVLIFELQTGILHIYNVRADERLAAAATHCWASEELPL